MANKAPLIRAYVETAPGLEEVAWLEVRRRFPQAQFREFLFARDERGIVLFDVAARPSELFSLRTAETIFLAGAFLSNTTRGYRDLRQLREQMVRSGDFGGAVNLFSRHRRRQVDSYRLIVRTYGKHEYNRQAVRRAVIQAVEALYPEWERVQEEPALELWANVLGSAILVGLRLPSPAPRPQAEGALPASVAEALVLLSDPQAYDHFLDPFAEDGAIVVARSAYPAARLLSATQENGQAATFNAPLAEGAAAHTQTRWQEGRLALADASVNKIATRLPLAAAGEATERTTAWLQEFARVLQPGATAIVLTRAYEQFKDAIRQAPGLEIRSGYSVTVAGEWGRIYLLERLDSER